MAAPLLRKTQALVSFFFTASDYLFVSLPHPRGRTRGRVVVDEEDSMDGTEITESIGPQDTGETAQPLFFDPLCTCWVYWEWYQIWTCTSRQPRAESSSEVVSVVVEETPSPGGWMRAFSWHSMLLLQGYNWKGLAWAMKLQWVCIFFSPLIASISPPALRLALRCSGKEPKANAL